MFQAVAELACSRLSERFVRSPATRGKALGRLQHLESVSRGTQMLLTSERDVCLHGRTEGVDVTVCVFEREHVVALGERAEVCVVFEKLLRHVAVEGFSAALVRQEKILRQSVRLVPGIGRVLVRTGALLLARKRLFRQVMHDGMSKLD